MPRFATQLRERFPKVARNEETFLALAEAAYPGAEDVTPEEAVEAIDARSRVLRLERHFKTVSSEHF